MQGLAPSDIFLFEDFRLDRRGDGLLRCNGADKFERVAIGSRALDILGVLIERAGEVVSKDEIIAAVWPGSVVEDSNLTVQLSALRRALDRGRSNGSCIQTVAGRGYRFVASVSHPVADARGSGSLTHSSAESTNDLAPQFVAPLPPLSRPTMAPDRPRISRWAVAAAVGAVMVAAFTAWWLWPMTKLSPISVPMTTPIAQNLVAPRMSIVVLPFANLSDDPNQQYFADGVTDDLTTDLSRIADLFVISRNTAFTYRNKPVDTKQIGRELGVRYVLEGSFRRSGNQIRINAQLIDAETDGHLWVEQLDRNATDLFAMQDEITTRIAVALNLELIGAEAARPTEHPDALDYILRGHAAWLKPPTREIRSERISLYEHALALDPNSVEAQSKLADALSARILSNMTDTVEADVLRAEDLVTRALAASPNSELPHMAKATLLRAQRRYAEAISEYETVLALDRNSVYALFGLGQCKLFTGSIEETIPLIERAIRLSPRDPELGVWYQNIGIVHLLQSHTVEAIMWLERARNYTPASSLIRSWLASAYGLNGETERATAELAEARRLSGDDRFSSLARLRALTYRATVPKIQALFETTHFAGLRKAGMPEE